MPSKKAVADLVSDGRLSHPSASRAVNAFSLAGCNDDMPLAITLNAPFSGVASRDVVVTSAAPGAVPF